jgi:hypothetical protein
VKIYCIVELALRKARSEPWIVTAEILGYELLFGGFLEFSVDAMLRLTFDYPGSTRRASRAMSLWLCNLPFFAY